MRKYRYYVLKSPLGYMSNELATFLVFLLCILLNIHFKLPVIDWIIAAIVAYLIASVLFPRVSNSFAYSRCQHMVNMEISSVWRYWRLDYFKERDKVEDLFRREFIKGLENTFRKARGKKIQVHTHKWVYENVMCSPEVRKLYEVDIVGQGDKNNPDHYIITANNILSLMPPWYIWRHRDKVKEYAMKKRLGYQLELTPHTVRKCKLP